MPTGNRIRILRKSLGMSQTELASAMHVTKQTLYKYEMNIVVNIPPDKIELAAKALGTTPSYIMGWEDQNLSCNICSDCHNSNTDRIVRSFLALNDEDREIIVETINSLLKRSLYQKGKINGEQS